MKSISFYTRIAGTIACLMLLLNCVAPYHFNPVQPKIFKELDMDGDGVVDFSFEVQSFANEGLDGEYRVTTTSSSVHIRPCADGNILSQHRLVVSLSPGHPIQANMFPDAEWSMEPARLYTVGSYNKYNGPGPNVSSTDWSGELKGGGLIGVRLEEGGDVRYGWIQIEVDTTASPKASLKITEYHVGSENEVVRAGEL